MYEINSTRNFEEEQENLVSKLMREDIYATTADKQRLAASCALMGLLMEEDAKRKACDNRAERETRPRGIQAINQSFQELSQLLDADAQNEQPCWTPKERERFRVFLQAYRVRTFREVSHIVNAGEISLAASEATNFELECSFIDSL